MDVSQLILLLKQYGPLVAVSLFLLIWYTRRIENLLDRNATIYDDHIKHLWETQQRLISALLGTQDSSQAAPTVDDIKKKALAQTEKSPSKPSEGGTNV